MNTIGKFYGLGGKTGKDIIVYETLEQWANNFDKTNRIVAKTHVHGFKVSTVFLSVNHAFRNDVPPILFETMVFLGGEEEGTDYNQEALDIQERYSTWDEAEKGHAKVVKQVEEYCAERRKTFSINLTKKDEDKQESNSGSESEISKES